MKRIVTSITFSFLALGLAQPAHGMRQALRATRPLVSGPKFSGRLLSSKTIASRPSLARRAPLLLGPCAAVLVATGLAKQEKPQVDALPEAPEKVEDIQSIKTVQDKIYVILRGYAQRHGKVKLLYTGSGDIVLAGLDSIDPTFAAVTVGVSTPSSGKGEKVVCQSVVQDTIGTFVKKAREHGVSHQELLNIAQDVVQSFSDDESGRHAAQRAQKVYELIHACA